MEEIQVVVLLLEQLTILQQEQRLIGYLLLSGKIGMLMDGQEHVFAVLLTFK